MKPGLYAWAMSVAAALSCAPAMAWGQDAWVSQVILMANSYCPRGTTPADGRVISVQSDPRMFSLLGARYGGDGARTFQLPKLPAPAEGMRYCIVVEGFYPENPQ